jgi:hypothetical protein
MLHMHLVDIVLLRKLAAIAADDHINRRDRLAVFVDSPRSTLEQKRRASWSSAYRREARQASHAASLPFLRPLCSRC